MYAVFFRTVQFSTFFFFSTIIGVTSSSIIATVVQTKSRVPKAVISMKELNAVFQPEKIGHAHGLQISYLQEVRTRNIFVYHENGQVRHKLLKHGIHPVGLEVTNLSESESHNYKVRRLMNAKGYILK